MEPLLEGGIIDQATGLIIGTEFGTVVRSLHASVIAGFPGICVFPMVEAINNRKNDLRRSTGVFLAAQLQGIKRDLLSAANARAPFEKWTLSPQWFFITRVWLETKRSGNTYGYYAEI